MSHPEHSPKTPRTGMGFFAAVRAFLRGKGTGARASIPRRRLAATLLSAAALLLLSAAAAQAKVLLGQTGCNGTSHTALGMNTVVSPHLAETQWSFSYSTTPGGPWGPVPGGGGTVTLAEAISVGDPFGIGVRAGLSGLAPEVRYYVLATASNIYGEEHQEASCETVPLRPRVSMGNVIAPLTEPTATSVQANGQVLPDRSETHWRFEYATSEAGPWTPGPGGTVTQAEAEALPTVDTFVGAKVELSGLAPGTAYYVRLFAESEPEPSVHKQAASAAVGFETSGPPLATTFAVHALHGESLRLLGVVAPRDWGSYTAGYHFEYITEADYRANGESFGGARPAAATPEVALAGTEAVVVGADLPELTPGAAYRFRLSATNTTPGNPVRYGAVQSLAVPVAPAPGPEAPCPNEAFRAGPSAHLPDCRAYEQVTPHDKGGAQEAFSYSVQIDNQGGLVGEDGEHLMLANHVVHWGPGLSPYFFSREAGGGWLMSASVLQSEAGLSIYHPELQSRDLTRVALSSHWENSENRSPNYEFKYGPPGGPYVNVATVPRKQVEIAPEKFGGWVAGNEDLSKAVLAVVDRTLIPGHPTGTAAGADLYEYSDAGGLRQTNVDSAGRTIGSCGATVATGGPEHPPGVGITVRSGRRAVSPDGRVFFYATPGAGCSGPAHLYMRVGGTETVDLGVGDFGDANPQGTRVLLTGDFGEGPGEYVYDVEARTGKLIHGGGTPSEDLSTFYFNSSAHLTPEAPPALQEGGSERSGTYLYRYDVATGTLHFLFQDNGMIPKISPDGRYVYGEANLPGLSSNYIELYRYDSVENVVECVSCASPYNPDPNSFATVDYPEGRHATVNDTPGEVFFSADGDYAYFRTIAALVPQDVNGEEPTLGGGVVNIGHASLISSSSTDVYEWRRDGVYGCARLQGCVSLISSGTNGIKVELLGTTASGRDVFFSSAAQLGPNDNDTALDVYDARVGGGEPSLAARPVECEGDACSTPASAPNDPTPTLLPFSGAVNLVPAATPAPKAKHKSKKKPKKKAKPKKKGKQGNRRRGG